MYEEDRVKRLKARSLMCDSPSSIDLMRTDRSATFFSTVNCSSSEVVRMTTSFFSAAMLDEVGCMLKDEPLVVQRGQGLLTVKGKGERRRGGVGVG